MEELQSLASIFSGGKTETVSARLKQIPAGYGVSSSLKVSLSVIEAGLLALGAKKQAADVKAVLSKFSGDCDGSVNELVARIKTEMGSRSAKSSRERKPVAPADGALARQIADELTSTVLDSSVFSGILRRLADSKQVSTPTLHVIANRFLGNSKIYKGRKPVIDDIKKRQAEDLLDASRRAAVKWAG